MEFVEVIKSHLLALPDLAKFAIVIAVFAGVPPLARHVRIPEVVALLLFGVVLGPHVLDVFGENRPIVDFFGELGKLLLMFSAGSRSIAPSVRRRLGPSSRPGPPRAIDPGHFVVSPWLCRHSSDRHRLTARIPHAHRPDRARSRCHPARTGDRHDRRHALSDASLPSSRSASLFCSGFRYSLATQVIEIVIFIPLILFGLVAPVPKP